MGIEKVRRWQWIVVGLAAGLAVARVRALAGPFASERLGESMHDQRLFERSLVADYGGRRLFTDVIVYPVRTSDGGRSTLVHLVAGKFFDGTPTVRDDGQVAAVWRPRCYVAAVPYRPTSLWGQGDAPDPDFTVLDYLAGLRGQGVTYAYAWWQDPRWATTFWTAGGFVMIGLVWPAAVNLLVFGTVLRPREEKGAAPGKVEFAPAAAATAGPARADDEWVALARLEGEPRAAAGAETPPHTPTPARPLSAGADPDGAAGANGPARADKGFGADADDFYPTERHGPATGRPR